MLKLNILLATALFVGAPMLAQAQGWKPERPVEFIVDCTPGCGPDSMVRLMQRVFQMNRYVDTPITI
jgi:tripartite-type tricarboxylate transporter receptor subunit TctC